MSTAIDHKNAQAKSLYRIGLSHRSENEFEKAEQFFKSSLEISIHTGYKDAEARARMSLGEMWTKNEDTFTSGVDMLSQAMSLFQTSGDLLGLGNRNVHIF